MILKAFKLGNLSQVNITKLGLKQRESYGGIIAAVKDVLAVTSCGVSKAYPS
jgi:hypothetical protein